MSRVKVICLLCSLLCFSARAGAEPKTPASAAKWTRESVVGLEIELIDPDKIDRMVFSDGGVAVSFGRKGEPTAKPLFKWRIVRGRLQFYWGKTVLSELILVSRDSSTIVIRCRGETSKYRIVSQ